jgi:hypothetical protein
VSLPGAGAHQVAAFYISLLLEGRRTFGFGSGGFFNCINKKPPERRFLQFVKQKV